MKNLITKHMGGVIISPNIKKTSARVNLAGDIIDPKTKQPLERIDQPDYVPNAEDFERAAAHIPAEKPAEVAEADPSAASEPVKPEAPTMPRARAAGKNNMLADLIKAEVKKAIPEIIKGMDLKEMLQDAIKDALTE